MLPDSGSPVLEMQAVRRALAARRVRLAVECVATIDSTNAELLRRAADGPVHGCALVAEEQTAGRGRLGRRWVSAPGAALTFSVGWRLKGQPAALSGLSLVVGVSLAESLAVCGAPEVRLKWPNDLLLRGSKLGGILIETRPEGADGQQCVIGVGLNWSVPPGLECEIGRPVAALAPALPETTSREDVLAACLAGLDAALVDFGVRGFGPFRSRWEALDAHRGRTVCVELPGGVRFEGRCLGLAGDGALRIETSAGPRAFPAGEVSLVGAA